MTPPRDECDGARKLIALSGLVPARRVEERLVLSIGLVVLAASCCAKAPPPGRNAGTESRESSISRSESPDRFVVLDAEGFG